MAVKITGAEWNAFYADKSLWKEYLHEGEPMTECWFDDAVITVDGVDEEHIEDMTNLDPAAKVRIEGGVFFHGRAMDAKQESLESLIRRYVKAMKFTVRVVPVPKDRLAEFEALLSANGFS